jgi:hypothetical protein
MVSRVRVRWRLHRGFGLGGLVDEMNREESKKVKGKRKDKRVEREMGGNEERREEGTGSKILLPNEVRVRTACLSKRSGQ